MQRKQSTEEKVLDRVNSVPKFRIFLFLRDNEGWFKTSKIAEETEIHRSNLSGTSGQTYLTDMVEDDLIRKRKDGRSILWDLTEELHEYTKDPSVHVVPDVRAGEEIDHEYDVDGGEIVLSASYDPSEEPPPTMEDALLEKFEIAGGLVGLLTIGLLMTLTGVVEALPDILPGLGGILLGGSLIGLGTVLVIAYQETS
jgi:predicted transcriptional regulator